MSTYVSDPPPMVALQRERFQAERPAIPWHVHPAWTVWAERHPRAEPLKPPPFYSDDDLRRILSNDSIFQGERLTVAPAADDIEPLYEIT